MKVSIVIPCYNEMSTIAEILDRVSQSEVPDKEIIVVDDCSTDGTREWLQSAAEGRGIRLILHETNLGKGAAIRSGVQHAIGDPLEPRRVAHGLVQILPGERGGHQPSSLSIASKACSPSASTGPMRYRNVFR